MRQLPAGRSLGAIFAVPLAITALSAVALVAALTGDGWRDALAWVGLAAPVAAVAWAMAVRRS
ncbi:hypothetical protein SAMN05192580_2083 [Sphingomonas jatrophae]|uniref:Uncharacterized protein n=1 Tax=Sphingomonas jatrophae TaxID=1166337 RepID=A0A1I6L077_9SPHN|nr:hypothetical protein SAMN05192580_2083 [Sphingomonas jatrophae]